MRTKKAGFLRPKKTCSSQKVVFDVIFIRGCHKEGISSHPAEYDIFPVVSASYRAFSCNAVIVIVRTCSFVVFEETSLAWMGRRF